MEIKVKVKSAGNVYLEVTAKDYYVTKKWEIDLQKLEELGVAVRLST